MNELAAFIGYAVLGGSEALTLEKLVKSSMNIVDSGVRGFRKESILKSDYNYLSDLICNYLTGVSKNDKTTPTRIQLQPVTERQEPLAG